MNNKLLFLIILILFITSISYGEPASWAKDSYFYVNYHEVLSDDMKDFAKLKNNITREEFAELAVKIYAVAKKVDIDEIKTWNPFTDTENKYVGKAYFLGIVKGTGESTFSPRALVTREQIATMFHREILLLGEDDFYVVDERFSDADRISSWAKEAVEFCKYKGIINGVGNNSFAPKNNATREQSIVLANNILKAFEYIDNVTFKNTKTLNGFIVPDDEVTLSIGSNLKIDLAIKIISMPFDLKKIQIQNEHMMIYEILKTKNNVSMKAIMEIVETIKASMDYTNKEYKNIGRRYIDLHGNIVTDEPLDLSYFLLEINQNFTLEYYER